MDITRWYNTRQLHSDTQAWKGAECPRAGPGLSKGKSLPLDGEQRAKAHAMWQDGGGAQGGRTREDRPGYSSWDGPLRRSASSGPALTKLLVARHGGCGRTRHQVLLIMRAGEGRIQGVGKGASAPTHPWYGLQMGGRFRGAVGSNSKGEQMDLGVLRTF